MAFVIGFALLLTGACSPAEGGDPERSEAGRPRADRPEVSGPDAPRPPQGRAWVVFDGDTIVAEVARTPEEREQGLMYRQELAEGTGMLFVFETSEVRSFWMQNTWVALDIAFLDVSFRVVDIQQMEPMSTDPHESAAPAMFALEVPMGWFEAHGIGVGDQAEIVFGR